MFSWINKDDRRKREPEVYASVAEGLRKLYQQVHSVQLCFAFTDVINLFVLILSSAVQ